MMSAQLFVLGEGFLIVAVKKEMRDYEARINQMNQIVVQRTECVTV